MIYLISYDLQERAWDVYTRLAEALTAAGAERVLLSQWVMASTMSSVELREWVARTIPRQDGDRILVVEVDSQNWAGYGLLGGFKKLPGAAQG